MNLTLTPKQALIIWNLIITREEPIKSKIKPVDRNPLKDAGLIDLDPPQARSQRIILTDKAWDWASENFELPLRTHPTQQERTLRALLTQLGAYLNAHELSLAEFIPTKSSATEGAKEKSSTDQTSNDIPTNKVSPDIETDLETDIETRIRNTYLQMTDGEFSARVLLSKLRQHLTDFPREVVDKTLIAMQLARKLVLMSLNDPQEIQPADEQAAISVGGEKRHIVYLKS